MQILLLVNSWWILYKMEISWLIRKMIGDLSHQLIEYSV